MDDAQTYLLNGLIGRQFGLGRIARYRQVNKSRQATTLEVLTGEQNEYLVHLLPPMFTHEHLKFSANVVTLLDENRFSVVPFVKANSDSFIAEGPQGTSMLVSLAAAGSSLPAEQYTEHDISQVGLRLAWMHRLLSEQLPARGGLPLIERLEQLPADKIPAGPESLAPLRTILRMPAAGGWAHGDISVNCLLHDADHQLRTMTDWALVHFGSPFEDLIDAVLSLCTDASGKLLAARGHTLLESYHSLIPIRRVPWTPVVGSWLAQRLLDAAAGLRPLPAGFATLLASPENLSSALASCI